VFNSSLHDEKTFYKAFLKDLENCKEEVIIESPFITNERTKLFIPLFNKLLELNVKIYVMTRDPEEHEENMEHQSEEMITNFEKMGVQVLLCTGNHHRKLAILDRKILWEGSLNILSQNRSKEIMRRIEDKKVTVETFNFLKLYKIL